MHGKNSDKIDKYVAFSFLQDRNLSLSTKTMRTYPFKLHEISTLENSGIHTESGLYSIQDWLNSYINHPLDHANQIKKQLVL